MTDVMKIFIAIMATLAVMNLVFYFKATSKLNKAETLFNTNIMKNLCGQYLNAHYTLTDNRLDRVVNLSASASKTGQVVPLFELTKIVATISDNLFVGVKEYITPVLYDVIEFEDADKDSEIIYCEIAAFISENGEQALSEKIQSSYDIIVADFYKSGTAEERAKELLAISDYLNRKSLEADSAFYTFAKKVRDAGNI